MLPKANEQEPMGEYREEKSFLYEKQNSGAGVERSKRFNGSFSGRFQLPKGPSPSGVMAPIRLLKHVAGEVARALCFVSGNTTRTRTTSKKSRSSSSSSTSAKNYSSSSARSKPFVTPLDSHRMEAIEDCIQFINSSCTLSRSNSTTNSS